MNIKNIKFVFVLAVLAFVSSGCDFYYRNMPFVPIPPQTISGPVVIGSEWVEVVPPKPLSPLGSTNWISLGYSEYEEGRYAEGDGKTLNLVDGRVTRIEALLFDDRGEIYELEVSRTSNGPQLHRKGKVKILNGVPDYSETKFPSDRVFVRLKIRSEISLDCSKIEWQGSKPQ